MNKVKVFAPGRINIIGEHTDYNLGYVLPTAIDKGLTFKFEKNGSPSTCKVESLGYGDPHIFDFTTMEKSTNTWHNYIQGVISEILKLLEQKASYKQLNTSTVRLYGFDCQITSTLPVGSGVSSSAALECGLSFGLNELFNLGLTKIQMVQLSQQADHNYLGVQSGIMDQFASMMSKEDHVILLDCRSLEHQYIPLDLSFAGDPASESAVGEYTFLLLNSGVSHSHVTSEYNTRQQECQEAIKIIQEKHPEVASLRDVTPEMLDHLQLRSSVLGLPSTYKRARFVVEENERVLSSVEALKIGDLNTLGTLLYSSHSGLRHDYEVSCKELDFLVDFTKDYEEVLGARIMGGGFGGCSINLVLRRFVDSFIGEISSAYKKEFDIELDWFEAQPSQGVSLINNGELDVG